MNSTAILHGTPRYSISNVGDLERGNGEQDLSPKELDYRDDSEFGKLFMYEFRFTRVGS